MNQFGTPVGLGCSRLGSTLSGCNGAAAQRLLDHAVDAGVRVFDSADIYGQGDSERLLGQALRGSRRDRAVVVTKAGQRFTIAQQAATLVKGPIRRLSTAVPGLRKGIAERRAARLPRDYSARHIRRAAEDSLRRLNTDHIDVLLLHSPSSSELAACESYALLDQLRREGLILRWGVSCDDAAAAIAALAISGMTALQLPLAVAETIRPALNSAIELGTSVFLRELFAAAPGDKTMREAALRSGLSFRGATMLVGTTNIEHLDEALAVTDTLSRGVADWTEVNDRNLLPDRR